jgi:hypothetical protein
MVSADKVFVEVANQVAADAPFPMARSLRVPAGREVVDAVQQAMVLSHSAEWNEAIGRLT